MSRALLHTPSCDGCERMVRALAIIVGEIAPHHPEPRGAHAPAYRRAGK